MEEPQSSANNVAAVSKKERKPWVYTEARKNAFEKAQKMRSEKKIIPPQVNVEEISEPSVPLNKEEQLNDSADEIEVVYRKNPEKKKKRRIVVVHESDSESSESAEEVHYIPKKNKHKTHRRSRSDNESEEEMERPRDKEDFSSFFRR